MPLTVTVFAVPTLAVANVEPVEVTVKTSPAMRLSESVVEAVVGMMKPVVSYLREAASLVWYSRALAIAAGSSTVSKSPAR